MTGPSILVCDEVRLVSAEEVRARKRRLWDRPTGYDAVSLYRLAYSSSVAALPMARPRSRPDPVMAEIAAIAAAHGVTVAAVRGRGRQPAVRRARREACYVLASRHPELSFPAIGALLDRDHTTIRYAMHRHAQLAGLPPVVRS